ESLEPGQIVAGILGGPHRMLGVEEIGDSVISAAELAHHIRGRAAAGAPEPEARLFGGDRLAEFGDVVIELGRSGKAVAVDGAKLPVAGDGLRTLFVGLGERGIAELSAK